MRFICLCLGLCLTVFTFACRQNDASSTSTAPASAPEKTPPSASELGLDDLTYVPGERFGKLSGFTLESDLKFLYGERIVPAEIEQGEGFTSPGYRLFPGTPDEVEIMFPDGGNGVEELTLILRKQGTKWRMPGVPLAVGTSLPDLEKLNGKPVTFLGFGWDYGGTVVDWNGGKLENIGVTLSYPNVPEGEMPPESLMGDNEISSDNPLLNGKGIYVEEILVSLPGPVVSEDGIPSATNFEIVPGSRFGALHAGVDPNDLELTYGVANVEPMDYDLDGGVTIPGFRLFPGTKNEVEVAFPDEDDHLDAVEFRISKADSDWHLAGTDVRVGDRLEKVRNANRQPFLIYSHNMEGGGEVHSWEGGRFAGHGLSVQFATSADGGSYKYDEDYYANSDSEEVKQSNPQVEMITISLKD